MKSRNCFDLEVEYRAMGDMHSVSWNDGVARYHYWTRRNDLQPDEDTLYKNPPLGTEYRDKGYFNTRHLSMSSEANRVWVEAIAEAAHEQGLLDKSEAAKAAKASAENEERRQRAIARVKAEHGVKLYDLLSKMLEAMEGGQTELWLSPAPAEARKLLELIDFEIATTSAIFD